MAISKVLKKAKPKTKPKVKPKPKPKKKRITPMELKAEVNKIKNFRPGSAAQDRNMERLAKKYDDNVTDFIYNEVMRDLKAKGGKVKPPRRPKPGDRRPPKRIPPKRPKPGDRRPKPLPRPLKPKRPNPGGRFQPKPRPDRDRMILPPRPRKNPSPRLPRAIKELTPEQRKRLLQLMKQKRRK